MVEQSSWQNWEARLDSGVHKLCDEFPGVSPLYLRQDLDYMQNDVEATRQRLRFVYSEANKPENMCWFFRDPVADAPEKWSMFSVRDSLTLEQAYQARRQQPNRTHAKVDVSFGRFEVDLDAWTMAPAYWDDTSRLVRRGMWFYRLDSGEHVPYNAADSDLLDRTYADPNLWGAPVMLSDGVNQVIIDGKLKIEQVRAQGDWSKRLPVRYGLLPEDRAKRPQPVGEALKPGSPVPPRPPVEHLLFVVHGIGANCDLDRSLSARGDSTRLFAGQVDSIRHTTNTQAVRRGHAYGCIEMLPVDWHKAVHEENDHKLKLVTPPRGSKLMRDFANDAMLDVLFFMHPAQCQTIMDRVGSVLNTMYARFKTKNPAWNGRVSIVGHSLGSVISFDLLLHQPCVDGYGPIPVPTPTGVTYPVLDFRPSCLFLLGSPVAMFHVIRKTEMPHKLCLPSCKRIFNLFHPFDPVAYRIEPLLDERWSRVEPHECDHHAGSRVHVVMRDAVKKLKKMSQSANVFGSLVAAFTPRSMASAPAPEPEQPRSPPEEHREAHEDWLLKQLAKEHQSEFGTPLERVDYHLQEAILENVNELLCALSSHTGYWVHMDVGNFITEQVLGGDVAANAVPPPSN